VVLLFIKIMPQICFFLLKHVQAFVLVELISAETYQIIYQAAGFGDIENICFPESLQEFQKCIIGMSTKFFTHIA